MAQQGRLPENCTALFIVVPSDAVHVLMTRPINKWLIFSLHEERSDLTTHSMVKLLPRNDGSK